MTTLSHIALSGNSDIDGVLGHYKWNASSLSYAFATSASQFPQYDVTGFQNVDWTNGGVSTVLGQVQSVSGLAFSQGSDVGSSDLSIAGAQFVDEQFAHPSDTVIVAGTFYHADIGGDLWLLPSTTSHSDPEPGDYNFHAIQQGLLTELGLLRTDFGHTTGISSGHDSWDYTVMSAHRYPGDGQYWFGGPQSLMQDDIAALQYLYGANYSTNAGDSVYHFAIRSDGSVSSTINGDEIGPQYFHEIYRTIWDGGGNDTYDFSNFDTSMSIDLQPGAFSTFDPALLHDHGDGHMALGNIANALLYQGNTASLIENAIGGSGSDTITGNQVDNRLEGGDGNDALYGLAGSDTLIGGAGSDNLDGGSGQDTLIGGTGDDTYFVDESLPVFTFGQTANAAPNSVVIGPLVTVVDTVIENPGEGIDTVYSTASSYTLTANVENLVLAGTGNINGSGNGLDNDITGNSGVNHLYGGAGNDTIDGGAGGDTMAGGAGDDTYFVDTIGRYRIGPDGTLVYVPGDSVVENPNEGHDRVFSSVSFTLGDNVEDLILGGTGNLHGGGNALDNYIDGSFGACTLVGGGGNDTILGNGANDTLEGDDGDDTLLGGGGADTLTGGAGNDYLDGGTSADAMAGGLGDDTYVFDQQAHFVDNGTPFPTYVFGDTATENPGEGTDTVLAYFSFTLGDNFENLTLEGTGDFWGSGNAAHNILIGNSGNNRLDGGGGADTMRGFDGNDSYFVDNSGDLVFEAAGGGTDTVFARTSYALQAGQSVEILRASSVASTSAMDLTGNNLAQSLYGNAGANVLDGGGGGDRMTGYGGNDTYVINNSGDLVFETAGQGSDTVNSRVSYVLHAGQSIETLRFTSVTGTADLNLTGNEVAQTLLGNNGDNVLDGKGGADLLHGYGGADTFVFSTALGSGNIDHIVDFSTTFDTIRLDRTVFAALGLGALSTDAFKDIGVAGAVVDASDRILYDHNTGELFYDSNGSAAGGRVEFAVLDNKPAHLTHADFFVVA